MLFFPSKFPEGNWNPAELEFEDVWMESARGIKIHGWYCPCDNPRAYLLYLHGNAGNNSHRAEMLIRLQSQVKVSVLIFDYRGYGRSEGKSTIFSVLTDAKAASRYLADRAGVTEKELLLMGRSLGGNLAIQLSAKLQTRGLIAMSPFSSLKDIAAHHYSALSWLVPGWILNAKSAIRKYDGKLLMCHGTNDFTIPYEQGVELFESANQPKSFFPIQNAGHNHPIPEAYYDQLDQFVSELNSQRGNE